MIASIVVAPVAAGAVDPASSDPYLWLEEVEGEAALDQVQAWNAASDALLEAVPGFDERRQRALAILNDPGAIVTPDVIGDRVFNHWVDANHKRGLWRSTSLASYLAGNPEWEVVIDVDALGASEGESWVWQGASCLAPDYRRCLVSLSPGGTDANVVREFDLATRQFVDDGFAVPYSKNSASWVDADTLLVALVDGEGTQTRSGYARQVRLWQRGTPLDQAPIILESRFEDILVAPFAEVDGDTRWNFIVRYIDQLSTVYSVRNAQGEWVALDLPLSAEYQAVLDGQIIMSLRDPLGDFASGSIVSWDLAAMAQGATVAPQLVIQPDATQAIEDVTASDSLLWVNLLEHVSGKLYTVARKDGAWTAPVPLDLPANSLIELVDTIGKTDRALVTVENFLVPTQLLAVDAAGSTTTVQALAPQFDPSVFLSEQRFATSADGTRIPYYLVRRKDMTEPTGALIHAYGGFQVSERPDYLATQPYRAGPLGLFWAEDGGAFVLANIRGGGEYGPEWHKGALREKRQNSFDDLAAVAEDLIAAGIARPDGIAISGRSNGGVLTGAGITQRPDLYRAAIIGSPLFDMQRYTKLYAGASWIGEYGDPEKPEDWAFMSLYSPYQNIVPGVDYPATFFYLSTKDDRVHPGHARKGAAKLKAYGNSVYYHEFLEGGHSVGADKAEDAKRAALLWAFLHREVGTTEPVPEE